ncbi:MAG: hypothetical protein RTU30_07185 [Candidatus Thorarchaeota archaeon]
MRLEAIQSCITSTGTSCDKPGCVVFYRGEHCIFCDAAREILNHTLSLYGLSESLVYEVDLDMNENSVDLSGIVGLPAIRICDEIITGLPDECAVGTALIRALVTGCFNA